eukprot:CAMPEP_0182452250 /NCGR_PEP_ID=MMETSP1172-20130603/44150_1 /TAXON_ID=708627 /ORGANISM="Timspurckia oligopyrenoides, Strain CCMP3278" /LENGTH=171 /DNA_ID=CAMNT_0024650073 /DNA_START=21 /DNA_END=536 /DNA_ORIENTATION=+
MGTQVVSTSAAVDKIRELVPFFDGDSDTEEMNVKLTTVVEKASEKANKVKKDDARMVELQVREWDHKEGWFALRTVVVEDNSEYYKDDLKTAHGSVNSKGTETSSTKKKATQKRKTPMKGAGSPKMVQTPTPSRFAGHSFDVSPSPSSLPMPTHLEFEHKSRPQIRKQLIL